ncbi:MAG: hypothetical protein AAFY10_05720 [Pseudomonadota bacterium]
MTDTKRYFDRHDASHGLYFDATALLEHVESEFQDIKIIETELHGRAMLLDDVTMLTQSTHHVYHEHMVHIPMACVEAPRRVLVIGGGDGGTVSELVKYPGLTAIELCELDGAVIEVSRKWLPDVAAGLEDSRVNVRIGDGAAYLADNPGAFDVIIIDSTDICEGAHDGVENASPLATDAFYKSLKAGLTADGVAIQMLGSTTFYRAGMAKLLPRLREIWPYFNPVMMPCPFYISGDWNAGLLSERNSLNPVHAHGIEGELKYFNLDVAQGALALPNEVRALLAGA